MCVNHGLDRLNTAEVSAKRLTNLSRGGRSGTVTGVLRSSVAEADATRSKDGRATTRDGRRHEPSPGFQRQNTHHGHRSTPS